MIWVIIVERWEDCRGQIVKDLEKNSWPLTLLSPKLFTRFLFFADMFVFNSFTPTAGCQVNNKAHLLVMSLSPIFRLLSLS
jgi:hypothetical protein